MTTSRRIPVIVGIVATMFAAGTAGFVLQQRSQPGVAAGLAGAWRGKVRFTSGMFVELKDLEYMYSFNAGGTMTESSNYDAVPPVPPAYGVWRQTGPSTFEAKYQWFQSRTVATSADLMKSGGWGPGGGGTIRQSITLSPDGNTFTSRISVEMFDAAGKSIPGGGAGTAAGERIRF